MNSQEKKPSGNFPHGADLRLKCCIQKENSKNNISGRIRLLGADEIKALSLFA
jgi:hypothetical protein